MPSVTEREARCRVFTFKEGLLSAVAHDLEIDVTRLRIEWPDDRSTVRATFDTRSLRVLHPMVSGRPAPHALSDRDRRKIEETIVSDVLHATRHPEIVVDGALTWAEPGSRARLEGTLTITGRSRPIGLEVTLEAGEWRATATIHQPDFGITPYSAMLGTLKIRPDVRIEVRIPSNG